MTDEELRARVVEVADNVAAEIPETMKVLERWADRDTAVGIAARKRFVDAVYNCLGTDFPIFIAASELAKWVNRRRREAVKRFIE